MTFFSSEYAAAAPLLVGIALYRIVRSQSGPLIQVMNGLDRPDVNMQLAPVALAVNLVLGVVLVRQFNAFGVVLATIVAETIRYTTLAYLLKKELPDLTLIPRTVLEQVGVGVVMFALVSATATQLTVRSWLDLGVLLGIGATVYGTLLLLVSQQLRYTIRLHY